MYLPWLHILSNSFLLVWLVEVYQCLQMLLQEHIMHKPHAPIWKTERKKMKFVTALKEKET